jgi:hypothetical protein
VISLTPFFWHLSYSDFLMRREALVISGVLTPTPLQNNFSPPPEPVDSIFGALKSVERPKRSATTVAKGYTVDYPTMFTVSRPAACAAAMLLIDAAMVIVRTKNLFM